MSCDISAGRIEPCKDVVGGIKNIYFMNYAAVTGITYLSTAGNEDVIEAVTGSPSAYKYELKAGNNFEQSVTSSRENGTTFVEQTLTAVLKKQDIATHKQIKLLSYGRPRVIVEDYNSNFWLMGVDNGAEVTTAAISTGTAMGDLSGYTLTLVAQEKIPAPFLDCSSESGLSGNGITVVAGS